MSLLPSVLIDLFCVFSLGLTLTVHRASSWPCTRGFFWQGSEDPMGTRDGMKICHMLSCYTIIPAPLCFPLPKDSDAEVSTGVRVHPTYFSATQASEERLKSLIKTVWGQRRNQESVSVWGPWEEGSKRIDGKESYPDFKISSPSSTPASQIP